MSPLQKAEIVKMIKNSPEYPVTAAVGDGANDVAMIQEAHVGLGIAGKEGRAAVRSSDYAFAKFKHLRKVILVHGHWFYYRAATLVQYFFYKNVAAFTSQVIFVLMTGPSDQNLFDPTNLTCYNIFYTSIPIFLFGLFEQNLSSQALLSCPEYYKNLQRNSHFSKKVSLLWMFDALWVCLINYFLFHALWKYELNETSDRSLQLFSFGNSLYQSILVCVSLRLLVHSRYWSVIFVLSIAISLFAYAFITMGMQGIEIGIRFHNFLTGREFQNPSVLEVPLSSNTYWVFFECYKTPAVWLLTFLCIIISLIPFISASIGWNTPAIYKFFKRIFKKPNGQGQLNRPVSELYVNYTKPDNRSQFPDNSYNNLAYVDDDCEIQITRL